MTAEVLSPSKIWPDSRPRTNWSNPACRLIGCCFPRPIWRPDLHNGGLHHRDLYLCHFLGRRDENPQADLRLIDAARVRPLPGPLTRRRWIVKDLAQFWYSTTATGDHGFAAERVAGALLRANPDVARSVKESDRCGNRPPSPPTMKNSAADSRTGIFPSPGLSRRPPTPAPRSRELAIVKSRSRQHVLENPHQLRRHPAQHQPASALANSLADVHEQSQHGTAHVLHLRHDPPPIAPWPFAIELFCSTDSIRTSISMVSSIGRQKKLQDVDRTFS